MAAFELPQVQFLHIIEGCERDLRQRTYPSFYAELEVYCQHVAGALQQLTAKICGFQQYETLNYARKLGTAIQQLSRILRNIHRDTRVGKSTRPRMRCRNRVFHKKTSFNRATAITCRACWRLCRAGLEATAGTGSRQAAIQPVSCAQFIALLKKRRKNNDRTLNQQLNEQISLSPLHKLRSAWPHSIAGE
ncbi:hypothetical protein MNBD_GAMMA20-2547 [hydrothermal vent metagenome]|uniref:Uncharacterized protein n=1 Tax=hydrothermal vent metagenome TaxID=652676 RepID=A0A3B1ADP3_9ZZZZ